MPGPQELSADDHPGALGDLENPSTGQEDTVVQCVISDMMHQETASGADELSTQCSTTEDVAAGAWTVYVKRQEQLCELAETFHRACIFIRSHCKNHTLPKELSARIYANYKQATVGPAINNPPKKDFRWEEWHSLGIMDKQSAMSTYVTLVDELQPLWREITNGLEEHSDMFWDPIVVAAYGGIAGVLLCVLTGWVLSTAEVNVGPGVAHPTACQLQSLGGEPALLTKPWEAANVQWFLAITLVSFFILRRYVLTMVVRRAYRELSEEKQAKVANYMLEIVGTTAGLIVPSSMGFWTLVFRPSEYDEMTMHQAYDLAVGMQVLSSIFFAMYILELSFDHKMRLGLTLHHFVALLLMLWALPACHLLHNDVMMLRAVFAMSLYMSTEQNVFVEMLFYYKKFYVPAAYTASAWIYVATRGAVTVLSLWTWWECKDAVFSSGEHNSTIVYGLWLFVPLANAILNLTQITTIVSLFGIARSVNHNKMASPMRKKLFEVFSDMDDDQSGTLDKGEIIKALKLDILPSLKLDFVVHDWAVDNLVVLIDTKNNGQIESTEFVNFFSPFNVGEENAISFRDVMILTLLQVMLLSEKLSNAERSFIPNIYDEHKKKMLEIVRSQGSEQQMAVLNVSSEVAKKTLPLSVDNIFRGEKCV